MQSFCATVQNISHDNNKRLLHRFGVLPFAGLFCIFALLCVCVCVCRRVEEIAPFLCAFNLSRKEELALHLCTIQYTCVEIFA